MRTRINGPKAISGMLLFAVVGTASAQLPDWQSITAERLLGPEAGDWLGYRRTYDVTAFSPLTDINRDTVRDLRVVWAYSMRDNSRWVATPIVANGLMYVSEGSGRVVAFDVVTGEVVWTHVRAYPEDVAKSEAYPRHRGVSIYEDTIYWGTADSYLVALDARTGQMRWETRTGDYTEGGGHAHPPLIADGKVFIGMSGGDFAARGRFQAFDARTGAHLWTLYTTPMPGEPGYETWTDNGIWQPAGGATWNTASYDPELGLVYFSTGQPAPWTTASRGPGDSLYTNTLIAADAETGEMRWHFQLVPADQWDRSAYEGMLVDLEIDGVLRKAVILTGKIGWGVVLDRATGEFLHAFRTAYDNTIVGWTDEGRAIYDPKAIPSPVDLDSGKVFEICPHIHGARNLQAPSYSPLTGLYYLGVNNSCMNAQVVTPEFHPVLGLTGVTYTASLAPGYDYVGEFVAFDPVTGERRWVWRPPSGTPMTASALATAGGVVFGGTADRQLFALDAETGELLWQTRLNGDVSGAPVTFEVDGKQYLAVAAGGRVAPTGTLGRLVGVDVPQGTGVLWVFALPDDAPRVVPRRERVLTTRSVRDGVFRASQAAQGEQLFAQECETCHDAANYTGANFAAKWGGATLGDVYQDISLSMPPAKPGGLTPVSYASILAYFLEGSGYPSGNADLPGDALQLRGIAIEAAAPASDSTAGSSPPPPDADASAGVRLDVARYDADGRLAFPEDADRWIPVGASIGSDYNEQAFDPAHPGPIAVAQIEPAAYDYFRANGRYADGTMLLLTFYAAQEKPEPALNGFVQGDVRQREIHVIDRERFIEEGRAFFVYSGTSAEAAAPLPTGSACVECHTAHGRLDGTFVQFYPALR